MRLNNKIVNLIVLVLTLISVGFIIGCGGGGGGSGSPEEETIIPGTTKPLDETTVSILSSISEDGSTYNFDGTTSQLGSLAPGDIIVTGVTDLTPYGALRKVQSVVSPSSVTADTQTHVQTTEATLDEAITKGSMEASAVLSASQISESIPLIKGASLNIPTFKESELAISEIFISFDETFLSDQIEVNGNISITPEFNFSVNINNGIQNLNFTDTTTATASLQVAGHAVIPSASCEVPVYQIYFTPITFSIGIVPVVIIPKLTVYVGVTGDVATVTTSITQQSTFTLGVSYANGAWTPTNNFTNDFQYNPPSVNLGCSIKGYIKPQLECLLYGVTGPYANIEGYLELDADPSETPWWILYGGLSSHIGVEIQIFSHVIAGYASPDLLGLKTILAQAETPSGPTIAVSPPNIDFGTVPIGNTKDIDFAISNVGPGTLTGSATGLAAPFSYVGDTNYSLTQGQSKNITVRFNPTAETYSSDYAEFSGGGGKSCKVEGTGYYSNPLLTPYVWVANTGSNTVTKLNVSSGSTIGTYSAGNGPYGIAVDASGNVWVTNVNDNTVTKFNGSNGSIIGTYNSVGIAPEGVAVDASGNIWVTNWNSNSVTKLNGSTGSTIGTYNVGSLPWGVAVDASSNVWVANTGSNTVTKLNVSNGSTIGTYSAGSSPYGIAVDASGNVWVTNENINGTVTKLNGSNGNTIGTYGVGSDPYGIAVDASGNIWVANCSLDGTVTKLNGSNGSTIGTYGVGNWPWGIAVDASGNVWVVNEGSSSNSVTKLNGSTGSTIGTYNVGNYPCSVGDMTGFALQYFVLGRKSGTIPIVSTSAATDVDSSSATLNGSITDEGSTSCSTIGFDYGITASYGNQITSSYSGGTGSFALPVSGLSPSTTYHFRAKAYNSTGWGYGSDQTFTTAAGGSSLSTPYVWVTNYGINGGGNTVTKLNSSNGSTIGTYSVGSGSFGIAVDVLGNAWVTNYGSSTVTKLNGSNGSTIGTYSVGSYPAGIAVDASGDVWVANYGSSTVTKLNGSNGSTIGTYSVGSYPAGIAVDASGNVWVANSSSNTVTKLSSSNGSTIGTYSVGSSPQGITVDASGNVWVANNGSSTVTKLNGLNGSTIGTYSVDSHPECVAVDASGDVWVANYSSNTVTKLNGSNGSTIGTYSVGSYPAGIAVDASGNVWVANNGSTFVTKLNGSNGGTIGTYSVGNGPASFGDMTGFALQYFVLGWR